ncbi:MAG: MFS transporter [Actinobacteria bacterium]|nr:MFS transporter [Actinomycetota bacterium]
MPTLLTTLSDPDEIAARQVPRDDVLVAETEVSPGRFVAVAGPFATWERTITRTDTGATERTVARLAVPHWAWFMHLALRRPMRHRVPVRDQTPWWAPGERVSARDATVLGLCATLSLIAGFLGGLIGQTMAYVAEDLGGTTKTQATALAVIRVGALLTFAATALADRRGRRPLLQATLVIASGAAVVTALAPNLAVVTVAQLVCRGLVAASAFLIPIVCAEELPAKSRSYAIGLMSLPGGLGVGLVLWLMPLINLGPGAWRILYACGAITLVVTIRTVRRLPESRRYEAVAHDAKAFAHQHISMFRFALLAAVMVLLNVFAAPVQQMQTDYLSNSRNMGPTLVAVFMLATNTWGFIGVAAGAQLADRSSRRLALMLGMLGLAIGNTLMFSTDGPAMWVGSIIGATVGGLVVPSLGALLPEMFPTLRRGAANGLMNGAGVCGSIIGLLVVAHFVTDGNYGPTVAALALGPVIVAVLIWGLPETAGVELEAINPDEAVIAEAQGAETPGVETPGV